MTSPNDELLRRVCAALQEKKLAAPAEIEKIAVRIRAGKVKAEDWYAMFENSLPVNDEARPHGN